MTDFPEDKILAALECGHCGNLDCFEVTFFPNVKRWLCEKCIKLILAWI